MLTINASKTQFILYAPKHSHIHSVKLTFGGENIVQVGTDFNTKCFKFLGHYVNDKCNSKCNSSIFALLCTKNILPLSARRNIYNSLVKSHLDYGSISYSCAKPYLIKKLYTIQKKAIRHVSQSNYYSHTDPLFIFNQQLKLNDIFTYNNLLFMHALRYDRLPRSFNNILQLKTDINVVRSREDVGCFNIPVNNTNITFPLLNAAKDWNAIPIYYKNISKLSEFKLEVKDLLITKYKDSCSIHNCYTCNKYKTNYVHTNT